MSNPTQAPGQQQPQGNPATREAARLLGEAIAQVQRVIVGQEHMVEQLMVGLLAKGHDVTAVDVYTVVALPTAPEELVDEYRGAMFDVVVVTSGSVAEAVDGLLGWPSGTRVVALGEPSAAALVALGVTPDAIAGTQDAAGVIAAIATTL